METINKTADVFKRPTFPFLIAMKRMKVAIIKQI